MAAFDKDFLVQVLADASAAADEAGDEWMRNAKPRYVVYNVDLNGRRTDEKQEYLLDVCGNSHLVVKDKRSAFYKALVKFGLIHDRYTPTLPIETKYRFHQEMGLHEACMAAAKQVLVSYNLAQYVRTWTYID